MTRLRAQLSTDLGWWDEAQSKIREVAWRYEKTHHPSGFLEAAAYVGSCTRLRVSAEAREFLELKGFRPSADEVACS